MPSPFLWTVLQGHHKALQRQASRVHSKNGTVLSTPVLQALTGAGQGVPQAE